MRFSALLKVTRVKVGKYMLYPLWSVCYFSIVKLIRLSSRFSCEVGFSARVPVIFYNCFHRIENLSPPLCMYFMLKLIFHGEQLLGRTINLRSLISERLNKMCRENIEFLFDRFESQDICAIVVSVR